MSDVVRRDSFGKKLSQLKKHFLVVVSFFSREGFSAYVVLFVGTGIFPVLPPIDTRSIIESEATKSTDKGIQVDFQEEQCRWQQDFAFFARLERGDTSLQKSEPCEKSQKQVPQERRGASLETDADLVSIIRAMTSGYPLEVMAPAISMYDRQVAGLIVGIAKKESNWGKRVPVDATGADCFNYWGFKGAGSRGVAMGHGCFGSPEEAVQAVGNRIAELVAKRETSEPKNMTIWKCGSSCATHSPESVRKWIADVDIYYQQIVKN